MARTTADLDAYSRPTRSTSTSRTPCSRSASLAGGTSPTRHSAAGLAFTPHTWTNGIGLLANLHLLAGVGGGPYLEFPYDPPGWTPERRDFMLAEPLVPDADDVPAHQDSEST